MEKLTVKTNKVQEVRELKKIDTDFISINIIEHVRELFPTELEDLIQDIRKTSGKQHKTIYNDKYTYIELINEWLDEYQNEHLYNVIND